MFRAHAALLALSLAGAAAVTVAQPRADATRRVRTSDQVVAFAPDGAQARVVATGFEEPLADLFWVRAVLLFGDRYSTEAPEHWREWFRRTIEAVTTLDPTWRTPYFYGGTLLRVLGDIEGSDLIYTRAAENRPDDFFFPFSLAMNAYLYRDDTAAATVWMDRAAHLPGAPPWYAAAAAGMHTKSGNRKAAVAYLEDVLRTTDNPAIAEEVRGQIGRMMHDELVAGWADACRAHFDTTGAPLASPEALASLGIPLPANPRGDAWVVGADGVVRSAASEEKRIDKARAAELSLLAP
jgi:tetratricopeptide (TPR) repeat protein